MSHRLNAKCLGAIYHLMNCSDYRDPVFSDLAIYAAFPLLFLKGAPAHSPCASISTDSQFGSNLSGIVNPKLEVEEQGALVSFPDSASCVAEVLSPCHQSQRRCLTRVLGGGVANARFIPRRYFRERKSGLPSLMESPCGVKCVDRSTGKSPVTGARGKDEQPESRHSSTITKASVNSSLPSRASNRLARKSLATVGTPLFTD